jgi:putative transposase
MADVTPASGHEAPPPPGYAALRKGRFSAPGRTYFLTACTQVRRPGLTAPHLTEALVSEARQLEATDVWRLRCTVVMPDHWHGLITLGHTVTLGQAMRLFKGRTTPALRRAGLAWQPAYFDHHLRDDEPLAPVFRYIFLNPYRKELLPLDQAWPGFWCSPEDWSWFGPMTQDGGPLPEWL